MRKGSDQRKRRSDDVKVHTRCKRRRGPAMVAVCNLTVLLSGANILQNEMTLYLGVRERE